ncbi:hypothetical protein TNCT_193261 [Trichonephila clavata]|uniref:Uncharacterized protein n=1 Tax=Trichonephila clavata TaxID=2740835 RepID=A0A8X6HMR4_TRICU|nr:hypothetical protein TNCT_193261 [Trichonephila clavata]
MASRLFQLARKEFARCFGKDARQPKDPKKQEEIEGMLLILGLFAVFFATVWIGDYPRRKKIKDREERLQKYRKERELREKEDMTYR